MPRRNSKTEGPHPVDLHVANRIKLRRQMLGMTQEQMAELADTSFQMIQKRERAVNRVSAATLYAAARALGVPIEFFFEGLDRPESPEAIIFSKTATEGAILIEKMEAVAAQFLIQMLRRLVQPGAAAE